MGDLNYKDFSPPKEENKRPSRLQPKWAVFVPEWKTTAYFFSDDACDAFMRQKGMK